MSGLINEIVEESLGKDPYKLPASFESGYSEVRAYGLVFKKDSDNNCYEVVHLSGNRRVATVRDYRDFVAGFLLGVHKDNL